MTSTPNAHHEPASATHEVDLAITGMTCASCSARIEKKLGKIEGVDAVVNLATEKATVRYADPVTVEDLLATVAKTGYGASVIPDRRASRADAPSASETTHGHSSATNSATISDTNEAAAHEGRDSGDHLNHDVAPAQALKRRALIAAALALPVVVLAMVPGLEGPWNPWLQFLLATPIVLWAAWPFHRAAAINARHLASTMDTLVSLGVLAAYGWSTVTLFSGNASSSMHADTGHLYFESAAVITTFLLIGRTLEARAKDQGRDALRGLLSLGAKDVAVQRVDATTRATTETRIPIEDLLVGDHFVVRPGEKVATDGTVLDGHSAIDTSLVTGESMPVETGPGDHVIGGTINAGGRLVVEATAVGADTALASIGRLVERAQTGKAGVQRLADRISAVFVPVVLALATLTFLGWWIGSGDPARALSVAIAVLIIACPCALGLATPMAMLVGTGRGAQLGVLIKGPQVLEDTRRIDTVLLDKTGTITTGVAALTQIRTSGRLSEESALRAAAGVERGSEHPIARAVVEAATERALAIPESSSFTSLPGAGARATIGGTEVTVGRRSLFSHVPDELAAPAPTGSTVWLGWDDAAHATLTVADSVRDSSSAALADLNAAGLTAYLVTGDLTAPAHSVAREVGIAPERVFAEVHPEDKHELVERLQREGRVVAMVGDGVNDAAALAQADLGIAMGSGTDVAADSSDIVLMRPELAAVVDAIELSRATLRIIKQNLAWAFGYNVAALPLAMAGLLNPMIAGAAMAMSSVLVVTNSLRLRGFGRRRGA